MALIVNKPRTRLPGRAYAPLTEAQIETFRQALWDLTPDAEIARALGRNIKSLSGIKRDLMNADPALRKFRQVALRPTADRSKNRVALVEGLRQGLSDADAAKRFKCSRTWVNYVRATYCPETENNIARARLVKRIERGILSGYNRTALMAFKGSTPQIIAEIEARLDIQAPPGPERDRAAADLENKPEVDPTEKHARALIREGGFWSLSERMAVNGQPIACLPLVPPPRELMEAFG